MSSSSESKLGNEGKGNNKVKGLTTHTRKEYNTCMSNKEGRECRIITRPGALYLTSQARGLRPFLQPPHPSCAIGYAAVSKMMEAAVRALRRPSMVKVGATTEPHAGCSVGLRSGWR